MNTPVLSEILNAEKSVWDALVSGDAAADAKLLSDDFLGVYETGFSDRNGHVGELANGPSIGRYHLSEAQLIIPGEYLALLCYRADYTHSAKDAAPEAMLVSSLWKKTSTGWINIFSQDTPVEPNSKTPAAAGN